MKQPINIIPTISTSLPLVVKCFNTKISSDDIVWMVGLTSLRLLFGTIIRNTVIEEEVGDYCGVGRFPASGILGPRKIQRNASETVPEPVLRNTS